MHGIKRFEGDAEAAAKAQKETDKKVAKYSKLLAACAAKNNANEYDAEGLKCTEKLLSINPEVYTMWNYRKKAIDALYAEEAEGDNATRVKKLREELAFCEGAVRHHPKSYWVYNQREWATTALDKLGQCDWERELSLCSKLLQLDGRNFHGWNYRRYVTRHHEGSSNVSENEFALQKIQENFSNYSAWHQRSKLLPRMYERGSSEYLEAISRELDVIQNAFYTEPGDQSAWFYHRWLINEHPAPEVLEREVERCDELIDIAENDVERKWPMLTRVFLRQRQGTPEALAAAAEDLAALRETDSWHERYYLFLSHNIICS